MRITKKMINSLKNHKHYELINQEYNQYKHYLHQDKTEANKHKNNFLVMAGFISSREA